MPKLASGEVLGDQTHLVSLRLELFYTIRQCKMDTRWEDDKQGNFRPGRVFLYLQPIGTVHTSPQASYIPQNISSACDWAGTNAYTSLFSPSATNIYFREKSISEDRMEGGRKEEKGREKRKEGRGIKGRIQKRWYSAVITRNWNSTLVKPLLCDFGMLSWFHWLSGSLISVWT